MYFCNLCHKFLPRCEPEKANEILETHCKSVSHQNAFVKKKTEEAIAAAKDALDDVVEVIQLPKKSSILAFKLTI